MRLAWVLLLALLPDDTRALRFCDRTSFNMPEAKGEDAKRVVEILVNREHWIGAYRTLEETFGRFNDELSVRVDFDLDGEDLANAGCRGNEGKIAFNLKKLSEHERKLGELRTEQKVAAKTSAPKAAPTTPPPGSSRAWRRWWATIRTPCTASRMRGRKWNSSM